MATIARPAAYVAAVAALLLSGIGVGLPLDSTRADDSCVSAPGAAAPEGRHWYYHFDRVKQRKCWYLHATVPLPKHVTANRRAAPSEPVASVATPQLPFAATPQASNAASAPQPAGDPPSEAAGSEPAPHVTVLAVKSVPALFVDTISAAQAAQAATPERAGEPPMRQISPNNANAPVDGVARPASGANPTRVPATTEANNNVFAPAGSAATASARTQPADLLLLLALALGIAAALTALGSKMVSQTRAPRLSDHPDDAWRRGIHEEDAPFLVPREPHGPANLDAHGRIGQSPLAKADFPAARTQVRDPGQSEQVSPTLKDIELALRALQHARQSISQT
jgi:hypothetical protein